MDENGKHNLLTLQVNRDLQQLIALGKMDIAGDTKEKRCDIRILAKAWLHPTVCTIDNDNASTDLICLSTGADLSGVLLRRTRLSGAKESLQKFIRADQYSRLSEFGRATTSFNRPVAGKFVRYHYRKFGTAVRQISARAVADKIIAFILCGCSRTIFVDMDIGEPQTAIALKSKRRVDERR
jgi:hypothetical protein